MDSSLTFSSNESGTSQRLFLFRAAQRIALYGPEGTKRINRTAYIGCVGRLRKDRDSECGETLERSTRSVAEGAGVQCPGPINPVPAV